MSTRYEGASTDGWLAVSVVPAGTELGDDVVEEGELALVFSYDEVFYITGPAGGLRKLLQDALAKVENAERDAPPK